LRRVAVALGVPLVALAVILVVVFSLSRLLLAVGEHIAVWVALSIALAVLAVSFVVALRVTSRGAGQ
jgi:uncharacterized membrane protein